MKGLPEFPPDQQGAGDVLSHLCASLDIGEKLFRLSCKMAETNELFCSNPTIWSVQTQLMVCPNLPHGLS
jgi:hypothetical protein